MPDVVGIRVKCPECGATVRAQGDLVKCEYCGTDSRVQRRTQVFQRPIPLPPPRAQQPQRVAVETTGGKPLVWMMVAIFTMFTIGGIAFAMMIGGRTSSSRATAKRVEAKPPPAPPPIYREWNSELPLLADVDGDGTEDVIGIVRYLSNRDEMHVAAQSGRDGHVIWETPSLGTYSDTYRAKQTIVDGVVLWGSTSGQRLEAFDLKTGAARWHVAPSEALEKFCRANDRTIVELADRKQFTLATATGALAALAKPIKCSGLDSRQPDRSTELWNLHLEGMSIDESFQSPTGWVLSTSKSPGTSIAMLAALDRKKKELWRVTVPARDPMTAKRTPFHTLGFDDDIIADTILYGNDSPYLEVFDRATGARKLDVPIVIPKDNHGMVTSIAVTVAKSTIFVMIEGDLQAYDRTTGQRRWHLRTR